MALHQPNNSKTQDVENLLRDVEKDALLTRNYKTEEDMFREYPSDPHAVLVRATNKKSRLMSRTQLLRLTEQEIGHLDAEKAESMVKAVKETKDVFQFTATATNTWDEATFQKWKHA